MNATTGNSTRMKPLLTTGPGSIELNGPVLYIINNAINYKYFTSEYDTNDFFLDLIIFAQLHQCFLLVK